MKKTYLQKIKIDKRSSEAIPIQIAHSIKSLLIDYETNYLDILPSISEIALSLNIKEALVNEAYEKLIEEKFIQKQGSDYIVNYFHLSANFYLKIMSINQAIISLGMTPSFKTLNRSYQKLPNHLRIDNQVKNDKDYLCLKRVCYGNTIPLVLLNTYIPLEQYESMDKFMTDDISLYELLEKEFGRTVHFAHKVFSVVNLDVEQAKLLNSSLNSASYQVSSITFDQHRKLIEVSDSWSIMNYFFEFDLTRDELLKIKQNSLFYI